MLFLDSRPKMLRKFSTHLPSNVFYVAAKIICKDDFEGCIIDFEVFKVSQDSYILALTRSV